jgi:hypothetical protein
MPAVSPTSLNDEEWSVLKKVVSNPGTETPIDHVVGRLKTLGLIEELEQGRFVATGEGLLRFVSGR